MVMVQKETTAAMASGARDDTPQGDRDAGGAARKKGKRAAASDSGAGGGRGGWWSKLDGEDMISLEALSSLPYPPFKLPAAGPVASGGSGGKNTGGGVGKGGAGGVEAGLTPHPYNFFDGKVPPVLFLIWVQQFILRCHHPSARTPCLGYRGTSPIRNSATIGPNSRTMPG